MKQVIQYVALAMVATFLIGLGAVFFEWFDERHTLCRDEVIKIGEGTRNGDQCRYPEQRVQLEKGINHMLAVCRCKP